MDRQAIYDYLLKIPYGKVTTYKHLAQKFWLHPRTIGKIMRVNPFPNRYPCCKVVGSDGKLTGYALGLVEKEKRLTAEGILIIKGKVVPEAIWEGKKGDTWL